jgi:hypothetical protein
MMMTVTAREFYHSSKLVDDLQQGGKLVGASNGKPKFIVSRCDDRPKMTRALVEKLANDAGTPPGFDSVEFLRSLKK